MIVSTVERTVLLSPAMLALTKRLRAVVQASRYRSRIASYPENADGPQSGGELRYRVTRVYRARVLAALTRPPVRRPCRL